MNKLQRDKIKAGFKTYALSIVVALAALILMLIGINNYSGTELEQSRQLTLASIKKATVQCYADEGRYPADLEYLETYYGIKPDYKRFNVVYDCIASNIYPNIAVYTK